MSADVLFSKNRAAHHTLGNHENLKFSWPYCHCAAVVIEITIMFNTVFARTNTIATTTTRILQGRARKRYTVA